jgi:alanine dehydrogenase
MINAALPFLHEIGLHGVDEAVRRNPTLARGVNVWHGKLVNAEVARALGLSVERVE